MREREGQPLEKRAGFDLIKAILDLNGKVDGHPPCEVVVMSKNSLATSFCLFNSINHHQLPIERAVLSGGSPLARCLDVFTPGRAWSN